MHAEIQAKPLFAFSLGTVAYCHTVTLSLSPSHSGTTVNYSINAIHAIHAKNKQSKRRKMYVGRNDLGNCMLTAMALEDA